MADPDTKERSAAGTAKSPGARYEDDLYTWVNEQVALLRAGRLEEIDAENIAEELSGVAASEFTKLRSSLRVLLIHMLKWDQQPEHRTRSWIFSIREQRRRYHRLLAKNPGLKSRLEEVRDEAYEDARDWAADETHLPVDEFPLTCPYEWSDVLERPFDPDSLRT
jgi:uncharacterized protein DUF29